MKASLKDNNLFSKIIVAISGITDLVNVECQEHGMSLQATDDLDVCMVSLQLNADGFLSYDCYTDCVLGLNVELLAKSIKQIDEKTSVEILCEVCEEHIDEVEFTFRSRDKQSMSCFKIFLTTIDEDTYDIPNLNCTGSLSVPSSELRRICKSLTPFGDTLELDVKANEIRFSVTGNMGFATISIRKPLIQGFGLYGSVLTDCTAEVVQKLSLPYMNQISKSSCLSENVLITLSAEGPVKFEYKMGGLGYISYYLAPIIDDI